MDRTSEEMYGHKWWLCWKLSVQCGRELNFLHSDITVIILHGQILILYNWRPYLSVTPRIYWDVLWTSGGKLSTNNVSMSSYVTIISFVTHHRHNSFEGPNSLQCFQHQCSDIPTAHKVATVPEAYLRDKSAWRWGVTDFNHNISLPSPTDLLMKRSPYTQWIEDGSWLVARFNAEWMWKKQK